MSGFRPLFDVPVTALSNPSKGKPIKKSTRRLKAEALRGCEHCPSNKTEGVEKFIIKVRGRSIMVLAQSPGPEENREGTALVGEAAEWFWAQLASVGINRKDCDIQYAMRCMPADWSEGSYNSYLKMRSPKKEELHCCSQHTDEALKKSKANQIIVLGQVAAKALLRSRSVPPQKTFWSDELEARVYLLDHPAFFLRGYGKGPRYDSFLQMLKKIGQDRKGLANRTFNTQDQFGYLRTQDYRLVVTTKQAKRANRILRKYASKGRRLTLDVEDDEFKDGRHVFAIGFSPKPGMAFTFMLRHKDIDAKHTPAITAIVKGLCEDPKIEKAMQYGCSDVTKLRELESIQVLSYTHDTNLSEYLRFSDIKTYGLDATTERRFPMFSGYKLIVVPELMARAKKKHEKEQPDKKLPAIFQAGLDAQLKWLEKNRLIHYKHLSLETTRLYNGADCDVTKRIEISNKKHVPDALMKLYIDLSFILYMMEPRGPLFDYEQYERLSIVYPAKELFLRKRMAILRKRAIRKLSRKRRQRYKPSFNPAAPAQCYEALYEIFGYEYPFDDDKINTRKIVLMMLGRKHEFPRLLMEWRKVSKVVSTYLVGYYKCASQNAGRLRTRWWATGTRTGRLSSGGSKDKKASKIINLQNIKRDVHMQNMCVADVQWRRAYTKIGAMLLKYAPAVIAHWKAQDKENARAKKAKRKPFKLVAPQEFAQQYLYASQRIEKWIRKNMPDLRTFLVLDYGQVEVRVAAQMANDKNLIADCQESDIHTKVGVTMTGWDPDRIKNDDAVRTLTKNVHFGILFGISKKNLHKFVLAMSPADMRDAISEEDVHKAFDKYFKRYHGIARFIESQRAYAREHHYVKTMFGMFQTLNVTDDSADRGDEEFIDEDEVGSRSSYWGNQCINGPVQGTAHQLMICALVNLIRQAEKYAVLGIPPMEVHDALYFNVRVLDIRDAAYKAKYLMEQESLATVARDFPEIKWKVPIVVDTKAGLRLGCKTKVDEKSTVGGFLIDWYWQCRRQNIEMNKELKAVS